jgi:type II secretory pathway component PulC
MKHSNILATASAAFLLGAASIACAAAEDDAKARAAEQQQQARLEAEYRNAMSEAEKQQQKAEASLQNAREQLRQVARQRELSEKESAEARAAREAEMAKMNEDLDRARRELQETSRELARVNREVARARSEHHATNFIFRTSEKPVIGVILGSADDGGVEILGVSPDGPSERGGLKKGDVIVAVDGRNLTSFTDAHDARDGLRMALKDMQAEKPLLISVMRDGKAMDLTVVPEVREPLTWQTITRFQTAPAAPSAPSAPVAPSTPGAPSAPAAPAPNEEVYTIEHIVVPEIDTEALSAQIDQMRADIDKRRAVREALRAAPVEGAWNIEFDELSELGNLALQDADVWFGLPLTRGLQLAEVDPGLGEYFKTDRGVLVLKAEDDNALQLESGDVILKVGDTEVNTPAEFMRALRGLDAGDELVMDIKRDRKDRTLKSVMPENRNSFLFPRDGTEYTYSFTTSSE